MKELLFTLFIGAIAGVIDILPMIKMKLDRYSILSAFVQYLIGAFIIVNTNLFHMAWWLKGGVTALLLAIPIVILVSKEDSKSSPAMILMSIIIGTFIGVTSHFLL